MFKTADCLVWPSKTQFFFKGKYLIMLTTFYFTEQVKVQHLFPNKLFSLQNVKNCDIFRQKLLWGGTDHVFMKKDGYKAG